MADASYDAVIVGGGNKGLIAGLYLTKYGGMDTCIFERRFELGGALAGGEHSAPGFLGDTHTTANGLAYFLTIERDFPDFLEKGGKQDQCTGTIGAITREDHKCCLIYNLKVDPTQEKTAALIGRLSKKDADTYMKIWEYGQKTNINEATAQYLFNLPPPIGEPDSLEKWFYEWIKQPDCPVDAEWARLSALEGGLQLFENFGVTLTILRKALAAGTMPAEPLGAWWLIFMKGILGAQGLASAIGTSHSIAHAYIRMYIENGGKYFTHSHVDKILIENGKAKGIRLADGTEIEARKLVLTDVDPWQLAFKLIGKENLPERITKKVATLRGGKNSLAWFTWALHEPLNFKAADFCPDVNDVGQLALGSQDPNVWTREYHMRMAGQIPPIESTLLWHMYGKEDRKARVISNEGITYLSEQFVVPAPVLSEKEWLEFKKKHTEDVIREVHEFAPNMTWDNVIGVDPVTPYDTAQRLINMPFGCWAVLDWDHWRPRNMRPISEWAFHRISPIENLYGCGAAWDPAAMADSGYKCYKIIAEDFGLNKPWADKGSSW